MKKLSDTDLERARELRDRGVSLRRIAAALDNKVSQTTIHYRLKGTTPHQRKKAQGFRYTYVPPDVAALVAQYADEHALSFPGALAKIVRDHV